QSKRIFFIGNGGSNSICSHMMEDFAKMGRFPTFSFSDAALITCYANDYGYENAMMEWLKIHFTDDDLLIAISSSGESKNILNAVEYVKSTQQKIITLSGFKKDNSLSRSGNLNIQLSVSNYGIVECFHQVILHIILDVVTGTK
ncbi:MAG TPA: SIS domain-containing protein, partial [Bacteroidia bacterium]|nr:SIS domain-containing protein [Bacteroidia bacterium]